ncbi:MAG TPA: DUF559 domain-containing protein [Polyangiaceae bacterium]|nr:DUF559 domain-containing protein [Polyangiaceae bacterium]
MTRVTNLNRATPLGSHSWSPLGRSHSPAGAVARRFIADFLAPAQRLVIEVDGAYHGERGGGDSRRDAALGRAGYRVVRIQASLVVSNIESALERIRAALVG